MKYSKIELWVATALFLLILYAAIQSGFNNNGYSAGSGQTEMDYLLSQPFIIPLNGDCILRRLSVFKLLCTA